MPFSSPDNVEPTLPLITESVVTKYSEVEIFKLSNKISKYLVLSTFTNTNTFYRWYLVFQININAGLSFISNKH